MDISPEAMEKLTGFNWPGNVRELNNVLERAVFVAEGIIEEDDIILDYHSLSEQENKTGNEVGTDSEFPVDLPGKIKKLEEAYIEKAVDHFGSYRKAAANLNISHTSLINKVKKM